MLKLSTAEIEEVVRLTFNNHRQTNEDFDMLPDALKYQAFTGAAGIIAALQELGYRISKPLKVV